VASQRTLLIDADILVYQAATSAEVELEWAEDEWTLHAHAGPAKEQIRDKFERLADELRADGWVGALSDKVESSPRTGLHRPTTSPLPRTA